MIRKLSFLVATNTDKFSFPTFAVKQGELDEHEKLVSVLRQVDVVISTLAVPQHLDQFKLIDAMKEAGNIKVIISILTR